MGTFAIFYCDCNRNYHKIGQCILHNVIGKSKVVLVHALKGYSHGGPLIKCRQVIASHPNYLSAVTH